MGENEQMPEETVFVSYSSEDTVAVKKLCGNLSSKGLSIWFAREDLGRGGEDFTVEIAKVIPKCKVMLLILSRSSISSPHVKREVAMACENNVHIYPVNIDGVDWASFKYLLVFAQVFDAYQKGGVSHCYADIEKGVSHLVKNADEPVELVAKKIRMKKLWEWVRWWISAIALFGLFLVLGVLVANICAGKCTDIAASAEDITVSVKWLRRANYIPDWLVSEGLVNERNSVKKMIDGMGAAIFFEQGRGFEQEGSAQAALKMYQKTFEAAPDSVEGKNALQAYDRINNVMCRKRYLSLMKSGHVAIEKTEWNVAKESFSGALCIDGYENDVIALRCLELAVEGENLFIDTEEGLLERDIYEDYIIKIKSECRMLSNE